MLKNVSYVMPAADLTAVLAAIDTINSKLPFLINLNEDEKQELFKMGPKSVDFVQDASEAARNFPTILPGNFNKDEYFKDTDLLKQLLTIKMKLDSMKEKVDDTVMEVGSEAMESSREIYILLKAQSDRVPGLKSVVEKLEPRFRKKRRAAEEPASEVRLA